MAVPAICCHAPESVGHFGGTVAKAIATVRNCCQRFELELVWVRGLGIGDSRLWTLDFGFRGAERPRIAVCTMLIIACCWCCCDGWCRKCWCCCRCWWARISICASHTQIASQPASQQARQRVVKCKIQNKWPRCCWHSFVVAAAT